METPINGPILQPSTEMEILLRDMWCLVLSVQPDSVGANDSFFQMGGDSVVAMRLVAACEKQGICLTVADIFDQPRLRDLATTVRAPNDLSASDAQHQKPLEPFSLWE